MTIVRHACPGRGACGGMYTANTMASRDRSARDVAAVQLVDSCRRSAERTRNAFARGAAIRKLLELDLKPRDIMTRQAFENAMVLVMRAGRLDECRAASDCDGASR